MNDLTNNNIALLLKMPKHTVLLMHKLLPFLKRKDKYPLYFSNKVKRVYERVRVTESLFSSHVHIKLNIWNLLRIYYGHAWAANIHSLREYI